MRACDHTEWNRDEHRNQHREDREFDRCRVSFEDQIFHGTVVAKRTTHVTVQESFPIISVAVIATMPDEVSPAIYVAWKREEERRTIESVLFAELRELFGSCLFTKNRDCRIAGDEFDEQRHERDDGPDNQQENECATEAAKDAMPELGFQSGEILAEKGNPRITRVSKTKT